MHVGLISRSQSHHCKSRWGNLAHRQSETYSFNLSQIACPRGVSENISDTLGQSWTWNLTQKIARNYMHIALLGIVMTYLAPGRISTRCVMKTVLNLFSDLHSCSWLWEFPKTEFLFWFDWIGRVFIPMYIIQKLACSNVTFNQSHEVSSLTAKDMHIHRKLAPKSFY